MRFSRGERQLKSARKTGGMDETEVPAARLLTFEVISWNSGYSAVVGQDGSIRFSCCAEPRYSGGLLLCGKLSCCGR